MPRNFKEFMAQVLEASDIPSSRRASSSRAIDGLFETGVLHERMSVEEGIRAMEMTAGDLQWSSTRARIAAWEQGCFA